MADAFVRREEGHDDRLATRPRRRRRRSTSASTGKHDAPKSASSRTKGDELRDRRRTRTRAARSPRSRSSRRRPATSRRTSRRTSSRSPTGRSSSRRDLFYSGVRPAINVGISVSRVGGNAQIKAMKSVAGTLQARPRAVPRDGGLRAVRLATSTQVTRKQLERGARLVEILKQGQYVPLAGREADRHHLRRHARASSTSSPIAQARRVRAASSIAFIEAKHPQIFEDIRDEEGARRGPRERR